MLSPLPQLVRQGCVEVRAIAGFQGDQLVLVAQLHHAGVDEHQLLPGVFGMRVLGELAGVGRTMNGDIDFPSIPAATA